jgi:hypothetical protein
MHFGNRRKHKDTEAQRLKEGAQIKVLGARLLCVFVPLCLCVSN